MLFLATVTTPAFGDTNQPAALESGYSIALHHGKEIVLSQSAVQTLCSNIVELLKTSYLNSSQPATRAMPGWELSHVKDIYRQTISTKSTYLIVSFKEPRNIKTEGGEINVQKIIMGLNHEYLYLYGGPTLFTKDDESRLVMYGEFDGATYLKLLKSLREITGDSYFD